MWHQESHKYRIGQTALDELILVDRVAVVAIEGVEDRIDSTLRVVVALAILLAVQVVDGLDQLDHLLLVDLAVIVGVVELEAQAQLLLYVSVRGGGDGDQELGEVNFSGVIGIENVEDLRAELLGFACRVELLEHAGELLLV